MISSTETLLLLAASTFAIAGLSRELRARARWRLHGLGHIDPQTGAATDAAVPARFPVELALAREQSARLVLVLFRVYAAAPESAGKTLVSRVRRHETLYRIDFDLFALVMVVADRAEAVASVARLGQNLVDASVKVMAGVAEAPADGHEFYDLVDAGLQRLAPVERFADAASAAQPA